MEEIAYQWGRARRAVGRAVRYRYERLFGRTRIQSYRTLEDGRRDYFMREIDLLWTKPFGPELAKQVVEILRQGNEMVFRHRDYCGIGIFVENGPVAPTKGVIEVASSLDGYPQEIFLNWDSFDAFEQWLAAQSDCSMSGWHKDYPLYSTDPFAHDNQRITRKRLHLFLRSED